MPERHRRDIIRLLVLGAHGRLGRMVVERLEDAHDVVALTRAADPSTASSGDVVVNLADTSADLVRAWARAGSRTGGYLDIGPTDASHRALAEGLPGTAPVLAGAGFASVIGDALAVVACGSLAAPVRVDVTVFVPSRRSLLAGATPRERAALVESVARRMPVLVDGNVVTEPVGQDRRLAWFPRPVGPHHAAAFPGIHWRTLPRVVPGLETVRTALALRSSTAEVLQALGSLARWERARDRLQAWAARPGYRGTVGERWAVVVEVSDRDVRLVRGWAYGHDRHRVTAAAAARLASRLQTAGAGSRTPVGPTEVMPAEQLLDDLAAATDLRWSVSAG